MEEGFCVCNRVAPASKTARTKNLCSSLAGCLLFASDFPLEISSAKARKGHFCDMFDVFVFHQTLINPIFSSLALSFARRQTNPINGQSFFLSLLHHHHRPIINCKKRRAILIFSSRPLLDDDDATAVALFPRAASTRRDEMRWIAKTYLDAQ